MTCKHDIGYTQDPHNVDMVWNWDIKEKENMNMGQDNKHKFYLFYGYKKYFFII